MGMDVIGKNPTDLCGRSFHLSERFWCPLWAYCEYVAPDIIPTDNLGYSTEGWEVNSAACLILAERLERTISSGECEFYHEKHAKHVDAFEPIECTACNGTSLNTAILSEPALFDELEQASDRIIKDNDCADASAHTSDDADQGKKCEQCNGSRILLKEVKEYDFQIETVEKFILFLRACNGFTIC